MITGFDSLVDFLLLGENSPDPVRRMIGADDSLDSTLREGQVSSPPRSARSHKSNKSNDHHNSTSTPKKNSLNKSPYDKPVSKSGRMESKSPRVSKLPQPTAAVTPKSSGSGERRASSQGQRSTTPHSHKSRSAKSSPGHRRSPTCASPG